MEMALRARSIKNRIYTVLSWKLRSGLELEARSFGDEIVVFNSVSGDTHLCRSPSDWVFEQLQRSPASLEDLIDLAVEAGLMKNRDEGRAGMETLLNSLKEIDLLELTVA